MTRKILEEVKFYERVKPYEKFKNGIFGSGSGLQGEHLITIDLDLNSEGLNFKDSFEWDILNEKNR